MTVDTPAGRVVLRYSSRDLKMLGGPFLPEGSDLVRAAGIYDNFTVAKGQNTAAVTTRSAAPLLAASHQLLRRLERDRSLLERDYMYVLPSVSPNAQGGAVSGLRLTEQWPPFEGEVTIGVDAGRPGQIHMTLSVRGEGDAWHDVGAIDLRHARPIATDRGTMRIRRRGKHRIAWLEELPRLVAALPRGLNDQVTIRHHYAGDSYDSGQDSTP